MHVCQHLEFNVTGTFKIFLYIQFTIAERFFRLEAGRLEFFGEGYGVVGDAHASPSSSGNGLDNNGKTDLLSDFGSRDLVFKGAIATWNDWNSGLCDGFSCLCLVAHLLNGFGSGPDKDDITRLALFGKFGVFG